MTERKPLSKSARFAVFKRDHFTCQYCGKKAPDVILEVDHIVPVAEGGTNDFINLVTSCRDCNRGKGKRTLDDTTAIAKQRAELDLMAEKQEQISMMLQWKDEMNEITEMYIDELCEQWSLLTGYNVTDRGRLTMKSYLRRFGYEEVEEAIEIAVERYFRDDIESAAFAYSKVGGICYNRARQRKYDAEQDN